MENPVIPNSPCRLLIVGEAWGSEEQRRSLKRGRPSPFVGKAGWFLRLSLAQAGILPQPAPHYPGILGMEKEWDQAQERGIFLTNVFQQRPGPDSNDLEQLLGTLKGKKHDSAEANLILSYPPLRPSQYLKKEHKHHLQRLQEEIDTLQPNLVLALGATALWALTGSTEISKARGAVISLPPAPKILPTYHPAAILRRWFLRPSFLADLMKAQREMQSPKFDRKERTIWHSPESVQELWEWWKRESPTAQYLSVDIETEANRWISEVGIALDETRALHIPLLLKVPQGTAPGLDKWIEREDRRRELLELAASLKPGNPRFDLVSYWFPDEEVQCWLFLKHVLEQRGIPVPLPMVGQNFLYDIQYLLRAAPVPGGIRVRGFSDDTMLMQHALYPGLEKSLGFMASTECNEPGWKDLRKKGGKEENE